MTEADGKRQRREVLKREINNLEATIAEGHRLAALLEQLHKRESEMEVLSEGLLAAKEPDMQARLHESAAFIRNRFADLGELA